ncbi:uncharacterized protein LOC120268246 [Dioscorea cayenensis subsp. rotundata]|uniref:Uncharacterized protein LOC120268246 n=1 Tax=Dioscorea cayennensis subsp. rotundata TaxID=55577 RepID=A0AB40BW03_DIOCR|nr:uncharacterized protein LOC120268246 [Dioscorea cayenensis subsp. rotundata]
MTSGDPNSSPAPEPEPEHPPLAIILHHLLPLLLSASLSVQSLVGRWRLLHSKLSLLRSSLSAAVDSSSDHPLLLHLLPSLLSTLRSLHSLSSRCLDPSLPSGKLLLQSDLDIASSSLSLHLHDLDLLLRSGLLVHPDPHSNAIVLSSSTSDLPLLLRDLFARLQIGSIDLKHQALDSLLSLLSSDPSKLSPIIIQHGDIPFLVRLLDPSTHSLLRDLATSVISILSTASDSSRRAVFDEGALGPLLRILESGSTSLKERTAAAIEAITSDPSNAWAILAYNGVPILINACRSVSSSSPVQALAAGSLNNISAVDDIRSAMVEEGAIPVLVDLVLSGSTAVQKHAVLCLWNLASSGEDEIRHLIVQEGGLQKLLQLIRDPPNPEIQEHALRAIHAFSASPTAAKTLSLSPGIFTHLGELITLGAATTQQAAAAVLCNLFPSEESKRAMAPCMASLVKIMEQAKPASAQESAARALVELLAVRPNRREFVRDEKSMARLVQMLDVKREEVCKEYPVSVVLALAGAGAGTRKRLADAGASHHLQKLVDAGVPGAKKALQRLAGSRLKTLFSMAWRE